MKKAKQPTHQIILVAFDKQKQQIFYQAGNPPSLPTVDLSGKEIRINNDNKGVVGDLIRQKTNIAGQISKIHLICTREKSKRNGKKGTFQSAYVVVMNEAYVIMQNEAESFVFDHQKTPADNFFNPSKDTIFDDGLSEAVRRFLVTKSKKKKEKTKKFLERKAA